MMSKLSYVEVLSTHIMEDLPKSRIGKKSLSRFTLVSKLGAGEFGEVWKAIDMSTKQIVALKIIYRKKVEDHLQEIRREIAILNNISSKDAGCVPGLACIYEAFDCDDRLCISMEYIEGVSLYEILRRYKGRKEGMSARLLYSVLVQLLTIVTYLHSMGIAHRDIKEENIIIKSDGTLYLVDFGLACLSSNKAVEAYRCSDKAGTLATMAPEVFTGAVDKLPYSNYVDRWKKADVWSIGMVGWELAMGQETILAGEDIARGTIKRIPIARHSNEVLSVGIELMLTPDPKKRPSAGGLLKCLKELYQN